MRDPDRLKLRGGVGASLLSAGKRESPPASARRRASAAVGAAVAAVATQSAASVAGATAGSLLLTKAGASIVAVVVVAAAVAVTSSQGNPALTSVVRSSPAASARAAQIERAAAPVPVAATRRSVTSSAALPIVPVPVPVPRPASSAVPIDARPSRAPLGDEVAALGRAQQALEGGHPADTLRLVDAFYIDFPQPHLRPESDALRIEALRATGDKAGARSFLDAFRAAHPESPLLEHLEAVVGP
jgi:hypothetical protein